MHANATGARHKADTRSAEREREKECPLLVIDHFHAAVLLDPQLTHDDVVDAAGGVGPGVGFIMSAEANKQTVNVSSEDTPPPPKPKAWAVRSPGQLQCDESFGLSFYALPPKLEFRVDGAMEDKILVEALGVEGTDRRVVAHLLRHPPEAQIFSDGEQGRYRRDLHHTESASSEEGVPGERTLAFIKKGTDECPVLPDELIGLPQ